MSQPRPWTQKAPGWYVTAIQDLRTAERAIIICTHNLTEAEELADQIAIIRRGTDHRSRDAQQSSKNAFLDRL